uniref:PD-(D/E)XK nuclease superfamily n=1 Tax=Dulem virus 37 TaxID=3145755 RepID=A0AAU8AXI1_9CAUD
MGKHALLSASGSARWLECTPSAHLELQFPKKSSSYAEEGTAAHELCELAARYSLREITKAKYQKKLTELSKGQYYNAEMQECANDYGQFISETVKATRENCPDAIVELEVKNLDFSDWAPEGFGTGDCVIVADDLLEIIDFKYGKGVRVEAYNNPQMRLYALGAIKLYGELYDIKRVRMSIIQPRINREPSTDEITVEELLDWAENYVKPRAALAFAGEGEFNPGEKTCKFCRAKEQCKARYEKNLALFDEAPDTLLITPDEAGVILEKASDIKAWLKDLENLVMTKLFEGQPVDGWKLVEGRSNRKYTDETQVAEAMKAAGYDEALFYERSLLGITAMEKAFGKKAVGEVLKDLIYKPQGKPTLAPATDKRPEFKPEELVLDAFDDVEE